MYSSNSKDNIIPQKKIFLEWFVACYFVIIHLVIVNILNWSTSVHMAFVVWWSVQLGFFNLWCSLEAIPCKNQFTSGMMQWNIAAWHFLVQSSSFGFFPDILFCAKSWDSAQFCFLLKLKGSSEQAEEWFFKIYNARGISQQHISTFFINGINFWSGFPGFRAV